MLIHLKRNEKLFINGAVIRLDRRGSIELLNDAQFLLENHVLQAEDAITPLRQLYFIIQTMLMDPENAHLTACLLESHAAKIRAASSNVQYRAAATTAAELAEKAEYFEALKLLRRHFALESEILQAGQAGQPRQDVPREAGHKAEPEKEEAA